MAGWDWDWRSASGWSRSTAARLASASTGEEGAGSTFYFTLPTVPAPVPAAPRPAKLPSRKPRVLVLSAEGASSRQLQTHLRQRGFQVEMAQLAAGATWQAQLLAKPPSAVVLDISQATDQSWAALQVIKGNPATQAIPVLLYAGLHAGGAVLELDTLTKPIEVTELDPCPGSALAGRRRGSAGTHLPGGGRRSRHPGDARAHRPGAWGCPSRLEGAQRPGGAGAPGRRRRSTW